MVEMGEEAGEPHLRFSREATYDLGHTNGSTIVQVQISQSYYKAY